MNSICIATYNGEKYIEQQVYSILKQISLEDEVIISDDNSTDNTLFIIRNINDKRITIISNDSNRHGTIGNFQNALYYARGKYIFLSDQDDVWFENNDSMNVLETSFYNVLHNGVGIIKNIKRSTYFGSHIAFNSRLLKYVLPFPDTEEIGHDLWIGLVAEMIGKVKFLDDRLMYYRRHTKAFCSIFGGSTRPLYKKLIGRFLMIMYVIKFKLTVRR